MRKLTCFVIIPSNWNGKPLTLMPHNKWGWVEVPSTYQVQGDTSISVNFDDVYKEIIKEAIDQVNGKYVDKIEIECIRGQDLAEAGDIVGQVLKYICEAAITITDITAQNPNVFLEYGIRLSVKGSLNIMISHERVKPPFNVEPLRCISYSTDYKEAKNATKEIVRSIESYLDQLDNVDDLVEIDNNFIRNVELHNGRQLERRLVTALEAAPNLVADLAGFLLTGKKDPTLELDVFEFLESVEKVLKSDKKGPTRAIEHLTLVSNIRGLDRSRLIKTYRALQKLCADNNLKEQHEYYLKKLTELEE